MQDNRNHQSGNALFIVLIAVALLASLSFAVSRGGRGNVNALSAERARLVATDIIEYSNLIANAVAQTRLRGFTDEQISFENNVVSGLSNSACADAQCEIFNGGGIAYTLPPLEVMDTSPVPDNRWHFLADNEIQDVGTTCGAANCADLILVLDELKLTVCQQLNALLSVAELDDAPPTDADVGVVEFTGTYGYSETIGDSDPALAGKRSACFLKSTVPAEYVFYKVLISR
jgi:hypothetical protein